MVDVDTGDVVQEMRFEEWGVVTLDTNPGFQPFGFAGGLLDADTGLTRFGARDYAAAEGRWTAKDPIGFGDINAFGYAFPNWRFPPNWRFHPSFPTGGSTRVSQLEVPN